MRATSGRRRAQPHARRFDLGGRCQVPTLPVHATADGVGVFCSGCDTWVAVRADGMTPVLHAPGGYPVDRSRGALRCEGTKRPTERGRPEHTFAPKQAKALRLVTVAMLARVYEISAPTVRGILRDRGVDPVGYLERPGGTGSAPRLYRLVDAARVLPPPKHR